MVFLGAGWLPGCRYPGPGTVVGFWVGLRHMSDITQPGSNIGIDVNSTVSIPSTPTEHCEDTAQQNECRFLKTR